MTLTRLDGCVCFFLLSLFPFRYVATACTSFDVGMFTQIPHDFLCSHSLHTRIFPKNHFPTRLGENRCAKVKSWMKYSLEISLLCLCDIRASASSKKKNQTNFAAVIISSNGFVINRVESGRCNWTENGKQCSCTRACLLCVEEQIQWKEKQQKRHNKTS